MLQRLLATNAPAATALIRAMVGAAFLSEGIQKFLFPAQLGAGRFQKIGLPSPEILGPFVGSVEIIAGALVLPWSMLLGSLFLLIEGAGPWSADSRLSRHRPNVSAT